MEITGTLKSVIENNIKYFTITVGRDAHVAISTRH